MTTEWHSKTVTVSFDSRAFKLTVLVKEPILDDFDTILGLIDLFEVLRHVLILARI